MSQNVPELRAVERVESTNDEVMALGRAGEPQGVAIAAHEQTHGRGRRGNIWHSPDNGSLYLSVLLRPQVPMSHLMGLSAVCAMGALDALWGLGARGAALKWPNDVVVGPRKLAGILVEAGTGEAGVFATCGIGVNLAAPEGIGSSDGSVAPLAPAVLADAMPEGAEVPGFERLAKALRDGILARCDAWAAEVRAGHAAAGPLAPILSEYFDRVPMLGQRVDAVYPDGRTAVSGVFCAVDVWGRATVKLDDGREVEFASEQASLRQR